MYYWQHIPGTVIEVPRASTDRKNNKKHGNNKSPAAPLLEDLHFPGGYSFVAAPPGCLSVPRWWVTANSWPSTDREQRFAEKTTVWVLLEQCYLLVTRFLL